MTAIPSTRTIAPLRDAIAAMLLILGLMAVSTSARAQSTGDSKHQQAPANASYGDFGDVFGNSDSAVFGPSDLATSGARPLGPVSGGNVASSVSGSNIQTPQDVSVGQEGERSLAGTILGAQYDAALQSPVEEPLIEPAAFQQPDLSEGAGILQSAPSDFPSGVVGEPRRMTLFEPSGAGQVDLSKGLQFSSKDGRYRIEMHDLTQFDARFFNPTGNPLVNSFVIPRQRFYFSGWVDDTFRFYAVLNRGYGSLDVLDSFAEYKNSEAFRLRAGRMKVPFSYEYYKVDEASLLAGERSVFTGNLSGNRQIGAMAMGLLFKERLEYAVGVFNGPEHSFQDFNSSKSGYFYLNSRPFAVSDSPFLKYLNIGTAYDIGVERDPLEPVAFHTANDETTTSAVDNVSPTFLRFNSAASEVGVRSFWTTDLHWYYKNFTSEAQYNGGFIHYNVPLTGGATNVRVPFSGYSLAATWFVTGENITSRKEVEPLHDFKISNFLQNTGALEMFSRWANLTAGQSIYSNGLVNPNLWSRNAVVLDNGANWYVNRFLRITAEWQYSEFGSPVEIDTNRFTKHINLFWFRSQLFY